MNKLFEYLRECGVTTMIPTPKGIIIPNEHAAECRLDVANLKPLVPVGYRCVELPKQYRDDTCGSIFIGKARVVDKESIDKVYSDAQTKLESLGK